MDGNGGITNANNENKTNATMEAKVPISSQAFEDRGNGITGDAFTIGLEPNSSVSVEQNKSSVQVEEATTAGAERVSSETPNQQQSTPECSKGNIKHVQGDGQHEQKIDSEAESLLLSSKPDGLGETVKKSEIIPREIASDSLIDTKDEPKGLSLVPNFRVEGAGIGDSSITVAVASLASAVPLSNSSCGVGTGDGPGSGSGPVSVQSSEEMKLSLVSWYSEPDDPSRVIGDSVRTPCCGESVQLYGRQAVSMTGSLMSKCGSEEKENKTPEPEVRDSQTMAHHSVLFANDENDKSDDGQDMTGKAKQGPNSGQSQRIKMHVQLFEQKGAADAGTYVSQHGCNNKKQQGACESGLRNGKPECPRCSRRSKSGSTTPATAGMHNHQTRNRTPANRRVIQSTKSSTELKKPIKSILKNDSRGSGGSGSGSDNKSSMDSLGSTDISNTPHRHNGSLMTRSDSGTRAKFNLNHQIYNDTPRYSPEDRIVSKLRRIEKYATLRLRKTQKLKPLDLSDTDINAGDHSSSGGSKVGTPGGPNDLMTKSMSFLEKSSLRGENGNVSGGPSTSANSTLKRQGSLRAKKSSPVWEPCTTRTTALRLQKMQEARAKSGGGYSHPSSGSGHSGSAHSGSGDSIHHMSHSTSSHYHGGAHSAPTAKSHNSHSHSHSTLSATKEKGSKVFAKLASAMGQTASSNQKRLKQEKAIQTEIQPTHSHNHPHCIHSSGGDHSSSNCTSLSPIPSVDSAADLAEQIRQLEKLANRYRNTALRFQSEYEKSEAKKSELTKLLQENQTESNEMIDFLQAEKSTLAESLAEIENEAKKWREQVEMVKNESQSRCSSLVRLSEQHKQEALKAQAFLNRLEAQSNATIAQMSAHMSDGSTSIYLTRQKVNALTDSLLKTYKVPPELLASSSESNSKTGKGLTEADLSSSLLLPLITSLATAFPAPPPEDSQVSSSINTSPEITNNPVAKVKTIPIVLAKVGTISESKSVSSALTGSTSLQNLNQAILEREAAEKLGLDDITMCHAGTLGGASPDGDHLSLKHEIAELNSAIARLLLVIRVIVIHCDKRVSTVASSILQCLHSMEDDKVGNIPEIAQVQKSLEAWRDNGSTSSGNSSNGNPKNNGSSLPCNPSLGDTTPKLMFGNGHTSPA